MRLPSRLTVLVGALLVLLPSLAVLQYHWVGQLSEAERDRMQRNLRHAAAQFREAFDSEVARAFISLQVDALVVRDKAWDRYAERYTAWVSTTEYPGLVANVFVIDAVDSRIRLRRWDAAQRSFQPASWEGPLAASRAHFEAALETFLAGDASERRVRPPFPDQESLLVGPLLRLQIGQHFLRELHEPLMRSFGLTVLQLDMRLIREQLLPALAQRHFTGTDGAAYRVAVVDAEDPRNVVYRSSPEAPTDAARADVIEPIFGAHGEAVMFLAGGAARQVREAHNLVVRVIRGKAQEGARTRFFEQPVARWRLLVQHQRGSLEAAVASVRQRNLLISFGILVLMGVSVGLLTLSSRRAQQLARQQMEFVAGVSHEFRTPVAVIRSAADNLSHGIAADSDQVRRYGDAIQVEARRLGEMVERVLQFAGIESGRPVARAPMALEPLIDQAIEQALQHGGDGFAVELERHIASDLPFITGDAAMLRSAIQNLMANAMKYGGPDRWVGVRATVLANRREVRITVEDHGPGIAPSDLPHIFDPFYRGPDAAARQIQGSGLGLALARRVVEAHGGRLTVVTREGVGSAFSLHLPIAAGAADAAGSQVAPFDPFDRRLRVDGERRRTVDKLRAC